MSIEIDNLSLQLGGANILSGVDAELQSGSINVLAGPNGAGKTSLLRVLCGELRPNLGRVLIDGSTLDSFSLAELAKKRCVMTQSTTVVFDFTTLEILEMSWLSGPKNKFLDVLEDFCNRCEIINLIHRKFRSLSGGEKQRVLFVRALLQVASLPTDDGGRQYLFLDEPTSNLDIAHELTLLSVCRERAAEGFGVVVVLHDLNLASRFADRILLLQEGELRAIGKPEEVLDEKVLSELYGTDIVVENNKAVGRLVIHS